MAVSDQNPQGQAPEAEGASKVVSREGQVAEMRLDKTIGTVLGVMGATALLFGLILYVIDPGVLPVSQANAAFGVVCLVFYAFTHRTELRRGVGARSTPLVALELVTALGVVGGVFALNWVFAKDPTEIDLTADGIYTLHPQSVSVAERLEIDITLYAFYRPGEPSIGMLEQAVELYRAHTDRLKLEVLNPDTASQKLLERFDMSSQGARIVFSDEASGRFTKVKRPSEEALTNALIEVAERRQRTVYFLSGHGEPSLLDKQTQEGLGKANSFLGNEGLKVASLTLIDRSDVPDDADVVLVAGLRSALLPNEAEALKIYLDRGGRVGVFLDPGRSDGLDRVFRPYGVAVGQDLVIDDNPASRALGFGPDAPVVQNYEAHPITDPMQGRFTMFFRARSVSPRLGLAKIRVSTLVQTSDRSFAETSTVVGEPPELDAKDLAGPVPLAVAVTKRTLQHPRPLSQQARLAVFGDTDFISNRFLAIVGNVDLFVNTVNWLAGDEDRITIRPPPKKGDRLPLTSQQQYGIMFFSVNLLPLLLLGLGLSVWAIRRGR